MNLNPSNPGNRWVTPLRSPRLSYLFWVGATSASSLGALSLCALMAEQAGATTVIPPAEEMTESIAAIGVPDLETPNQEAIATLPMRSALPSPGESPRALTPSIGLPPKGEKSASSTLYQPSPILHLDTAKMPIPRASDVAVSQLQHHETTAEPRLASLTLEALEPSEASLATVPMATVPMATVPTEIAQTEPVAAPPPRNR